MSKLLYRFRYFLFLLPLAAITPLVLSSQANKQNCTVQYGSPRSFSAQKNATIYSEVFGNESCSPNELVLGIPVNAVEENQSNVPTEDKQHTPKISTIITSSSQLKAFNIRRIDKSQDGYSYSNKDSCLAWNWSEEDEQQVLNFTMERNLQINTPKIEEIIFIVSLPLELQSGKTKITIDRHVKNKVGLSSKLDLREYFNTGDMLKQDSKLNTVVTEELEGIVQEGGFFYDKNLSQFIDGRILKKPYTDNQDSSYCAIPQDWK